LKKVALQRANSGLFPRRGHDPHLRRKSQILRAGMIVEIMIIAAPNLTPNAA
jgi:hypothetical protein